MNTKVVNLPEKIIHVWYCDFEQHLTKLDSYLILLSSDEKIRSERFKFKRDKECYIISRGILRLLLGKYLKLDPRKIEFEYTSYGKPYLSFENALNFNISHSGNMASFAFFQYQEIGVDIEKIKDDFDVLELAQNFFSKTEITSLEEQSKDMLPRAFFRCWTRKESFIKAEGSGLSFPLDQFAVSLDSDDTAELLETKWNENEKQEWRLYSFTPKTGYIGAVSVKHQVDHIQFMNFDSED